MELDELLGIDQSNPFDRRARELIEADRRMLSDLVQRRHQLGLTQKEVARRMDISQSAVARIESGARDLHQSTLRRYAMAVEATLEHTVVPDTRVRPVSGPVIAKLREVRDHWGVGMIEMKTDFSGFSGVAARYTRDRRGLVDHG